MNILLKKCLIAAVLSVIPMVAEASLSWSHPVPIRAEGRYDEANLSINELNQAMVIGVGTMNGRDVIQASFYSNVWYSVVNCSTYGPYYLFGPKVVLNNKKNALAIWHKVAENSNSIQAAYASNGVWSAPVDITNIPERIVFHQLAFNDAGEGIAVWVNNTEFRLQYATFSHGKWSNPEFLTEKSNEKQILDVRVCMNQAGEKIVIWMSPLETNDGYALYALIHTKEGWGERQYIGIVSDWNQYDVKINNKGEAIIAWIGQYYKTINSISYANKQWSASEQLAPNASGVNICISLNNHGNAFLSWSDSNTVTVVRKFKGVWNKPQVISSSNKNTKLKKVILNDLEEAIFSYTEADPLDPVPFPTPKPEFGIVRGYCNETWERPIMLFAKLGKNPSIVIDIALNNCGQGWAIGWNKKGFQVVNGSF